MKRVIRENVFESNSSSCHSLAFSKDSLLQPCYMEVNDNNKITVELGEFGWGYDEYTDWRTKLSYLLTMCAECTEAITEEGFYESEEFKEINDAIAEYCHCDGVVIVGADFKTGKLTWKDKEETYLDFDGYIDHQSQFPSIKEFLDYYHTDIVNFIFDEGIKLVIDNDNY